MNTLIKSIDGEYRRYKALGERALEQVSDAQLSCARARRQLLACSRVLASVREFAIPIHRLSDHGR